MCLTTSNVFTITTGDTAPWGIKARMPLSRNTCAGVLKLVSTFGGEDQISSCMKKNILLFLFILVLMGCDGIEKADGRYCEIVSEAHLDISPESRELQVKVKRCDSKTYELDVSLQDTVDGKGWVLIKQELVNSKPEPTIPSLDIKLSKTEFREYTLSLPGYIAIDKNMSLSSINSKNALNSKILISAFSNNPNKSFKPTSLRAAA